MITAIDSVSETVRAAFPFSIDKLPLTGPDYLFTPHYGLFRSDTGASVGAAVRKGYQPHSTDDICASAKCFFSRAISSCQGRPLR